MYNNAIHTDGQGRGVLGFKQIRCLIAIYKGQFTLPAGDSGRYIVK
jgi:hypothetical protein